MNSRSDIRLCDALYGDIVFPGAIADLLGTPAVQRLRSIRLSNIDSLSMPGIANISRYEHAIGAAYLASRIGFKHRISRIDALVLQAAALLHDVAITAFGHLVEEALHYIKAPFDHEMKLSMLLHNSNDGELGGIDLQLYAGRESGLRAWAQQMFGVEAEERLRAITEAFAGKGKFGPCISGGVDLDNLDNVTRIAFHMGLAVDRELPIRIARGIVGSTEKDGAIFDPASVDLIGKWLELRRKVYNRLMLSRDDFIGKVMLIYATVAAYLEGDLDPPRYAWTLTDSELIQHLLHSRRNDVVQAVSSWLVRDLWPLSDLIWMDGEAPDYARMYDFSEVVTTTVGRPCFAYGIRDKRVRLLKIRLESGDTVQLGAAPNRWVLGVASRKRESFTTIENRRLQQVASEFFGVRCLERAEEPTSEMLPLFQ